MFNKYSRWVASLKESKMSNESKYYYFFDKGEAEDALEDLTKLGCVCEPPRVSEVCETDEGQMWLVDVTFPV